RATPRRGRWAPDAHATATTPPPSERWRQAPHARPAAGRAPRRAPASTASGDRDESRATRACRADTSRTEPLVGWEDRPDDVPVDLGAALHPSEQPALHGSRARRKDGNGLVPVENENPLAGARAANVTADLVSECPDAHTDHAPNIAK